MPRIYDYYNNTLSLVFKRRKYNLKLRDGITIINGNSASGKTLLVSTIKELKKIKSDITDFNVSNILLFDDDKSNINFDDTECLVIIDKGERVLTNDICEKIVSCRKARFLIFTRGSHNLYCSPNHFGEFIRDENGIISIYYKFNVPGWG